MRNEKGFTLIEIITILIILEFWRCMRPEIR